MRAFSMREPTPSLIDPFVLACVFSLEAIAIEMSRIFQSIQAVLSITNRFSSLLLRFYGGHYAVGSTYL
jgi:hypothetical protein